ncbi:MAG: efflux RND transporter periplasmic adaptor subunit, partial [Thermodesulfobacteriota bacterium]|nr:efflux RND transporter periplasmic adaptor subunit [Thermodesulfobacteriota bacterium]
LLLAALPAKADELFTPKPATRSATLTGFTRPKAEIPLVSENAGKVLEVLADIGETVPKSGVFARLDPTFIELDFEANQVEQARLESEIAYLDKEAARYRILVRENTAAQASLDKLEQDLEKSRHQLEALKVQEKTLQEKLSRCEVKARPGWKITARNIEPGEWVAAGQTLGQAGDFSSLIAPFALTPEEYAALSRQDAPLTLTLPDFSVGVPVKIYRVSPDFDPKTRKINVDLALGKDMPELRGGLRTELTLKVPDKSGAVLVPKEAITERYEEYLLTRENGQTVRVMVLGPGPEGMLRVVSPEVHVGDKFQKNVGK